MRRSFAGAFVVATVLTVAAVPIAWAQAVPPSLRACAAETKDAERLACFDREIARLSQLPTTINSPAAAVPPPPPGPPLSAEENFGRRGEMVRKEREEERTRTPALKELSAVVTKVSARAHGELVVTLDNGQVWVQELPDPHFSVAVQDKVKIKPGALGSFLLAAPSGRSTRVRRLR